MFNKILKGCFALTIACMVSTSAMAVGHVTGLLSMQFGMENNGGADETSHWSNHYLGSVGLEAVGQKFHAQVKIKFKSGRTNVTDEVQFEGEEMKVTYKAMDNLKIAIGHDDPSTHHGFCKASAIPAAPFIPAAYSVTLAGIKSYGLFGEYKVSKDMKLYFALLSSDPFRQSYWGDHGGAPKPFNPEASLIEGKDNPGAGGSGMSLAINGSAGSIDYKAAYTTGTSTDDTDSTYKALDSNGMMISGKYHISKTIAVAMDYETQKKGWNSSKIFRNQTNTGVHISLDKMGPGKILLAYGMKPTEFDNDGTSVEYSDTTYTNLAYEIFMEPISKIVFYYADSTETFKGDYKSNDTINDSFVGIGFIKIF